MELRNLINLRGIQMNKLKTANIAKTLGADVVINLQEHSITGPLTLLHLREKVENRLSSSGGRPTDSKWGIRRQVPFQEKYWHFLQDTSKYLRKEGEPASAGQLAAILLEDKINEIIAHKEHVFQDRAAVSI